MADVATIGILSERAIRRGEVVNEQLQLALNSRIIIEQAKGAVAQTYDIGVDEAFKLLRTHARRNHLRLTSLSHDILSGVVDPTVLRTAS